MKQEHIHIDVLGKRYTLGTSPSPELVRSVRAALELTQEQAADVCYLHRRAWQSYETEVGMLNARPMPPDRFEFFLVRTGLLLTTRAGRIARESHST